jgi:ribosomally synthesized peptide (two-chain TOMM family)
MAVHEELESKALTGESAFRVKPASRSRPPVEGLQSSAAPTPLASSPAANDTRDARDLVSLSSSQAGEFSTTLFKYAWSQIIACAWRDPEWGEKLYSMTPEEIRRVFLSFEASIPDDLDVTIVRPNADERWDQQQQRWFLRGVQVSLPLPPKPEEEKDCAVALADYDYLGRTYPLSCCC